MVAVENIKPFSYMKDHTAEAMEYVRSSNGPVVLTQDGEAAAVLMGAKQYQDLTNSINLMKILSIGINDIKAGRFVAQEELDAKVKAVLDS
jgi:prevent-host-death family protein